MKITNNKIQKSKILVSSSKIRQPKGAIAISQILILIIGIVAISYSIGSEIKEVSAGDDLKCTNKGGTCSSPIGAPEGSSCTTNGVAGIVEYNLCLSDDSYNTRRCCVPPRNSDLNIPPPEDKSSTPGPVDPIKSAASGATNLLESKGKNAESDYKNGNYKGKDYLYDGKDWWELNEDTSVKVEDDKVKKELNKQLISSGATFLTTITTGLMWAGVVSVGIALIGQIFKIDSKYTSAATLGASSGIFAGYLAKAIGGKEGLGKLFGLIGYPTLIGIGVGIAVFLLAGGLTKKETKIVQFTCYPWEAPTGGKNCEECNKQNLPCSEYQCRSLGQACQLVNPGTDEEKCVWKDRNDVQYPIIQPWQDALTKGFSYNPDSTISPSDRGVRIIPIGKTNGCIPEFTPLSFGITTNEVTSCKIDYINKNSFENMSFYFGGSNTLRYNHTQTMSLPGGDILKTENLTLENDNEYELSVRCQDANGNSNPANFIFKFCVDEGPDTAAPLIITTNLLNGMPIAYNQTSVDLNLYINEPSECKWSHTDRDYKDMESNMSCSSSVTEMNAQMLYTCKTTLTGLKDRFENKFYFRCKDQPKQSEEKRNTNSESYEFTLIGTQPLVIDSVGPNETVKDSTDSVRAVLTAHTSAGYKDGEAICYFSETGNEGDYIQFLETQSYIHTQDLFLKEGTYTYYIKCVDLGGNTDIKTTNFSVESDNAPPIVVRAYHEENYLKLITNENGECVYDTIDCSYNFDDGTKMTSLETKHFTGWSTESTLYIKCRDSYGNQPAPNECSIIIRGVE